ncbi:MAG: hypothetical protein FWG78_04800 [Coriobacteriia bacterium]|nr:hypothetical protein [Coriobacteriia bacterium]
MSGFRPQSLDDINNQFGTPSVPGMPGAPGVPPTPVPPMPTVPTPDAIDALPLSDDMARLQSAAGLPPVQPPAAQQPHTDLFAPYPQQQPVAGMPTQQMYPPQPSPAAHTPQPDPFAAQQMQPPQSQQLPADFVQYDAYGNPYDAYGNPIVPAAASKDDDPGWLVPIMRAIGIVLLVVAVIFAIGAAIGFATNNERGVDLGGYHIYYMRTQSMEPDIPFGSLVIASRATESNIVVGDKVAFMVEGNPDVFDLAKVVRVNSTNGRLNYMTLQPSQSADQAVSRSPASAISVVQFYLPDVGLAIELLMASIWWIAGGFVLGVVLLMIFKIDE